MEKKIISLYDKSQKIEAGLEENSRQKLTCRGGLLAIVFVSISVLNCLIWPVFFRPNILSKFDSSPSTAISTGIPRSFTNEHLVPLEAHIMSKCPDAQVEIVKTPRASRADQHSGLSQNDDTSNNGEDFGES